MLSFDEYGCQNNLFLENGGWTLVLHSCFLINIFNGFSSILNFYDYNISLF